MQHIQDNSVNSTTYDKAMRTFQHSNLSDRIDRSNGCQIRHTLKKRNAISCHTDQTIYHAAIYLTKSPNQKNFKTSIPVKHNTVT